MSETRAEYSAGVIIGSDEYAELVSQHETLNMQYKYIGLTARERTRLFNLEQGIKAATPNSTPSATEPVQAVADRDQEHGDWIASHPTPFALLCEDYELMTGQAGNLGGCEVI